MFEKFEKGKSSNIEYTTDTPSYVQERRREDFRGKPVLAAYDKLLRVGCVLKPDFFDKEEGESVEAQDRIFTNVKQILEGRVRNAESFPKRDGKIVDTTGRGVSEKGRENRGYHG